MEPPCSKLGAHLGGKTFACFNWRMITNHMQLILPLKSSLITYKVLVQNICRKPKAWFGDVLSLVRGQHLPFYAKSSHNLFSSNWKLVFTLFEIHNARPGRQPLSHKFYSQIARQLIFKAQRNFASALASSYFILVLKRWYFVRPIKTQKSQYGKHQLPSPHQPLWTRFLELKTSSCLP